MNQRQSEQPFNNFEVIDLTTDGGNGRLREILLPEPLHQASPAGPALLDTILRSGLCQSVVVEHNYIDREHSRAYQKSYARAFPDYPRYATRLHFFEIPVTMRNLSNLERPRFQRAYLGYCVVRPLRARKVGRTVIRPVLADPAGDFPLTTSSFDVNLAGSKLTVEGAPFQEQDGRVAVCASCAIWMSTMMAGRKFDLPTSTSAEITELALDFPLGERVSGSLGLSAREMVNALRNMGYNPLSLGIKDRESALKAIHPYMEAGIAPILLLDLEEGGHAVVTVGHGYDSKKKVGRKAKVLWEGQPIRFWRSSQWINYLLVHDDQHGPFRQMRFLSAAQIKSATGKAKGCYVEIDSSFPTFKDNDHWPRKVLGELYGVIIPVPPNVSMEGIEAEEKAARLVHIVFESFGLKFPSNIVLRTYLTPSNEFKRFAYHRNLPPRLRDTYRSKPMPRWLWVTELCTIEDATVAGKEKRVIRGEIVLDCNASPFNPDFVLFHLVLGKVGFFASMEPADRSALDALHNGFLYDEAAPYLALVR